MRSSIYAGDNYITPWKFVQSRTSAAVTRRLMESRFKVGWHSETLDGECERLVLRERTGPGSEKVDDGLTGLASVPELLDTVAMAGHPCFISG
jgi:hypothetical protein